MGSADHESIAFPIAGIDGWVVSFVMSLTVSFGGTRSAERSRRYLKLGMQTHSMDNSPTKTLNQQPSETRFSVTGGVPQTPALIRSASTIMKNVAR
jgi:hypothetical protein